MADFSECVKVAAHAVVAGRNIMKKVEQDGHKGVSRQGPYAPDDDLANLLVTTNAMTQEIGKLYFQACTNNELNKLPALPAIDDKNGALKAKQPS